MDARFKTVSRTELWILFHKVILTGGRHFQHGEGTSEYCENFREMLLPPLMPPVQARDPRAEDLHPVSGLHTSY